MTQPLAKPARLGPRIVMVPIAACDGCPALRLAQWRDATGEHTSASCSHLLAPGDLITGHWRRGRPAPRWCPGMEKEELETTDGQG